jgi:hypothetical protein
MEATAFCLNHLQDKLAQDVWLTASNNVIHVTLMSTLAKQSISYRN